MTPYNNVLQLVEHLLPGGAERMAVNISNSLAEKGHNVVLCPTRDGGALLKEVDPKVTVVVLHKKSLVDLRSFLKLYRTVKKYKIQLIHAHSSSIVWACIIKLVIPSIKIIWHDHYGNRLTDSNNKIYIRLARFIDGIISVNESLCNWAKENMRIKNPNNIIYLGNFTTISKNLKNEKREETIRIVVLANLRPEKDHLNFLMAYNHIQAQIKNIPTEVFFAGLYWDNDYYKSIQNYIQQNNLQDKIHFLGSVNQVGELLESCDIGVLSSNFEGLPVSLLEYGAAGLATIATDVGQCAQVLDEGRVGMIVPKTDSQALAKALLELIKNNEKRSKLGALFQEQIRLHFSSENFYKHYKQLLVRMSLNSKI